MRDTGLFAQVYVNIRNHRKLGRLARKLGITKPHATGLLAWLWGATVNQTTDGDLSDWDRIEIAEAAGWDGDEDQLFDALVDTGWLDVDRGGKRVRVHGWSDYCGRALTERAKEAKRRSDAAERKRRQRDREAKAKDESQRVTRDSGVTDSESHGDVTGDNPNEVEVEVEQKETRAAPREQPPPKKGSAEQQEQPPVSDKGMTEIRDWVTELDRRRYQSPKTRRGKWSAGFFGEGSAMDMEAYLVGCWRRNNQVVEMHLAGFWAWWDKEYRREGRPSTHWPDPPQKHLEVYLQSKGMPNLLKQLMGGA